MKVNSYFFAVAATLLLLLNVGDAQAQFTTLWLDIGEYQHRYVESGALSEGATGNNGLLWPAIMRNAGHIRSRAMWIGVKDWTNPNGQSFPWYTSRMGPRDPGVEFSFPVSSRLISRYDDPVVEVDGAISFSRVAILDEVDPSIIGDRMVHTIYNMDVGVTTERKAYAWDNEFHDKYHVIEYVHTNTGNVNSDEGIELPDQTLNDVYFFRVHRWSVREQVRVVSSAQTWGKFSMPDQVGDGHADYPVDFTAWYLFYGFDPSVTQFGPGGNLGAPLWFDNNSRVAEGDSVGRLAGGSMQGRILLHADNSPSDETYIKCTPATAETCQPHTMGFQDQDEELTASGSSHENYYEFGILTRENPARVPGGHSRQFPHYADRVEPSGEFWNPTGDSSTGKQGGHANTVAYGPYQMAPGDDVRIVVAEGVGGLTFDAQFKIGRAFKRGGQDRNVKIIEYDADGDGVINTTPFDYSQVFTGAEAMTKNQWVHSARDSLFATFMTARSLYDASNDLTTYPIPEAPRPPKLFSVFGRPDKVDITWEADPGGSTSRAGWEIYRTERFEDNIYGNGCRDTLETVCGYKLIATLDGGASSYQDTDLVRGTDYYYYIQAVSAAQPNDPLAINGTPGGVPLRSNRYYTQTYQPANLKRAPGASVADFRVVPNPVNLGADQTVRFDVEDRMAFFNIPGQCTIKIYTEIGELVQTIVHTDGSGDETWNMTTDSRQLLVSGIYIAVVEDTQSGDMSIQKFTVLR